MAVAKLKVGDRVNFPACPDGSHQAGTGTITQVDEGPPVTYTVKCGKTKDTHDFKESDLTVA